MKRSGIMLLLVAGWCGCQTYSPTPEQAELATHLTEMMAARNSMSRYYNDGSQALRALLENRNEKAELTFKKNVNWSRFPVPEIEALLAEVDKQIQLIQEDLTSLDGYMFRKRDANKEIQPAK